MTEVLEAIAVVLGNATDHDSSCCFCKDKETDETRTNKLTNSAAQLRSNMNGAGDKEPNKSSDAPVWTITCTDPADPGKTQESEVRSNPHHLIPGNASLKGHPILDLVKGGQVIESDIGFDINGDRNGIWLPTIPQAFYGGTASGPTFTKWGDMTTKYPEAQYSHAELAMIKVGRQFHDAHPDYSNYVKKRLDELAMFVALQAWECPEVTEDEGKAPPPYGLVDLLYGLSQRMGTGLVGDPVAWKAPKFTSRHAQALSVKRKAAMAAGR